MKSNYSISWLVLFFCILTACKENKPASIDDFTQDVYSPQYSTGFDIKGAEGQQSVIITSKSPWQGAGDVLTRLFVARNGESAPEGFDGQVLDGDARRIVAMSSTHIAMLNVVGADSLVVGGSGIDYISNPNIQSRRSEIGDVGYEGNINYELLLSLEPDLVLIYGVNGESPMESKLKELGVPYMYVGDYLEESPLGKAEWLVAVAETVGRRTEAEAVFSEIPRRYDSLKEAVKGTRPKIMVNAPYGDSWSMPSSESYMARLIADAGGELVYRKNTGNVSMSVDLEEAYELASAADIWINVGTAGSLAELKTMCPKFTDTRCFSDGMVYNNNLRTNASGGNDYFESGVVNPDLILRDLIKIFHPEQVKEDFVYYKQLE